MQNQTQEINSRFEELVKSFSITDEKVKTILLLFYACGWKDGGRK